MTDIITLQEARREVIQDIEKMVDEECQFFFFDHIMLLVKRNIKKRLTDYKKEKGIV